MRVTTILCSILLLAFVGAKADTWVYQQTNLVSDGAVSANTIDPDLKNPWGLASSSTSPFWVADNGVGRSTLYDGTGAKLPLTVSIFVSGAAGPTPAAPTGMVYNGTSDFHSDTFLFATESGTISGWRGFLGTQAEIVVDSSGAGASYTGLAILGSNLYAANFAQGKIDVFDSSFGTASLPGSFLDPNLPAGYAPFNIQNIGGKLIVTYASTSGGGGGYVDAFDANGNLLQRLVTAGYLDDPWGLSLAPVGFGDLGGKLLVGNSGNGTINAFDFATGAYIATLKDQNGIALANDNLWGLQFGNSNVTFNSDSLYFAAGLTNEEHGLFGRIDARLVPGTPTVPEPASVALLAAGVVGLALRRKRS